MKNYGKLLFQRMTLISLCILLQGAVIFGIIYQFSDYSRWFSLAMTGFSWIAVLVILYRPTDPSYKIAWIVPILAFPIFGISLYFIFGGNRMSHRQRKKMFVLEQLHCENLQQDPAVLEREKARCLDAAIQSTYLIDVAQCPVYDNTATQYYSSGEAALADMLSALDKAKHYIFIEYFIIHEGKFWDAILEKLEKRAAAGVDVRVLYDDFGCIKTLPAGYYKKLEAVGIKAACFNRFVPMLSARLNNRDHRKFMIIDGTVGFTGGINLGDEYINAITRFGYWKDCVIRLEGQAVWSMAVMFLSMWDYVRGRRETLSKFHPDSFPQLEAAQTGFVQPFADSPLDNELVGETVFFNLITRAKSHIYIMTPYLIISDKMITTLATAAKNGLDVRIITPGIPDKKTVFSVTRAHYGALAAAGVKIYEYTPGFLHSKVFCVDGEYAMVGTVNFDFRSLYLHFEDGIWMYKAQAVSQVEQDFLTTFPQCHHMTPAEINSVSALTRVYRAILRMFAPLM